MAYGRYDSFEGIPTIGRITPVTNKDQIIPGDLWDPHYSDRRFTDSTMDGLTIFVDPAVHLQPGYLLDQVDEGLTYVYGDRVMQGLGYEVVRAAEQKAAHEAGNARSARFIEHMLRHAFKDNELWLGHMRAGVNLSSGYSYKIYGFRSGDPNK